jgi:hypothetical protein
LFLLGVCGACGTVAGVCGASKLSLVRTYRALDRSGLCKYASR